MSVTVRPARAADLDAVLELATSSFTADPCARWLWPNLRDFRAYQPVFFRGVGSASIANGTLDVIDDLSGFAAWEAPGSTSDGYALEKLLNETLSAAQLATLGHVFEKMAALRPKEPHWYLPTVAVDPHYRHQGRALALVAQGLKRVDEQHLPVYTEGPNPRMPEVLAQFGFEFVGENKPGDFPGLFSLYRKAR